MNARVLDRTATAWLANLPASKEAGVAEKFDGKVWLAGYFVESAHDRAEVTYLALGGFMAAGDRTPDDLWGFIVDHGMAMLEAWGSTIASVGADREPWAREAADRAALVYRNRVVELMDVASLGGEA